MVAVVLTASKGERAQPRGMANRALGQRAIRRCRGVQTSAEQPCCAAACAFPAYLTMYYCRSTRLYYHTTVYTYFNSRSVEAWGRGKKWWCLPPTPRGKRESEHSFLPIQTHFDGIQRFDNHRTCFPPAAWSLRCMRIETAAARGRPPSGRVERRARAATRGGGLRPSKSYGGWGRFLISEIHKLCCA